MIGSSKRPVARALPGQGGGLRGPGLAPLPNRPGKSGKWWVWLLVAPLLLAGLTYLLGRTVDSFRQRLVKIPLAGPLLFRDPVWPILWNKPPAGQNTAQSAGGSSGRAQPAGTGTGTGAGTQQGASSQAGALSDLEAAAAARIASAELREKALAEKEAELKAREQKIAEMEAQTASLLKQTEELKKQLEGQLRTEQARVEVFRAMKSSAQLQMMTAMTDDEVITIFKYLEPDEVGKIVAGMDPYRAARILHLLTRAVPQALPSR